MNLTRFKSICEMIFGRSWQSQVADYLLISRKTVSSWIDRGSVPAWVEKEIKPLVIRRSKEVQFALESLEMSEDDFYHNQAILNGQVFHYDTDHYNIDDIKKFIENQKWIVFNSAKDLIKNENSTENAKDFVESDFLSSNDIASHLEQAEVDQDEILEIQNLRGDACREVLDEVERIGERILKNK